MQEAMDSSDVRKLLRGEHVAPKPTKQPCPPVLTIEIPIPPSDTRPNARCHWAKKLKAVKQQRTDAATAAAIVMRHHVPPRWKTATIEATFYRHSKNARVADRDNLIGWLKASKDGLQDAGVIANDSGFTDLPPKQVLGKDADFDESMVVLVIRGTS